MKAANFDPNQYQPGCSSRQTLLNAQPELAQQLALLRGGPFVLLENDLRGAERPRKVRRVDTPVVVPSKARSGGHGLVDTERGQVGILLSLYDSFPDGDR